MTTIIVFDIGSVVLSLYEYLKAHKHVIEGSTKWNINFIVTMTEHLYK